MKKYWAIVTIFALLSVITYVLEARAGSESKPLALSYSSTGVTYHCLKNDTSCANTATVPPQADGTNVYCSDCVGGMNTLCTSVGSGAWAFHAAGAWYCGTGGGAGSGPAGPVGPGAAPTCQPMAGATPVIRPLSTVQPEKDCYTETLSASTTACPIPAANPPANGWVGHIFVTQPSGGHSYTFTLDPTACTGTAVQYMTTGGCSALPTMPTGTGHSLIIDMLYNSLPATPELDIVSCPTTGS